MKKTKQYMTVNLQLFADPEGDTNPEESASNEEKEANSNSKQTEDKPFTNMIRSVFGLKDKELAKEADKKSEETKPVDKTEEKPVEKKADEATEPVTEPDTKKSEQDKPEFDEILYNKEVVKIPVSDRKTYLQKGYNYDKVKADADNAKATLNRIAQAEGFNTVDEYLAELSNREKAKLAEQVEEAAGDPAKIEEIINKSIENNSIVRQTREERRKMDFEKAVAEISKDKFFKELEPEFNALMEQNPNTPPELVYKIIRSDYLTPERLNELIEKEKESVKASVEKKVIADVHDKERRTPPKGGDTGDAKDVVVPTDLSKKLAGIFGVSASKIAQRSHEIMKRS